MKAETIPLPEEKASEKEPFQVRVKDLYAWPDQELVASFRYSDYMERWKWELEHVRLDSPRIATSKVLMGVRYSMWPYMLCKFVDESGEQTHVSPRNLGDEIKLAVYPGPLGGSFHPDAGFTQREEDAILRRYRFGPIG